jgi:hypothetical protein
MVWLISAFARIDDLSSAFYRNRVIGATSLERDVQGCILADRESDATLNTVY